MPWNPNADPPEIIKPGERVTATTLNNAFAIAYNRSGGKGGQAVGRMRLFDRGSVISSSTYNTTSARAVDANVETSFGTKPIFDTAPVMVLTEDPPDANSVSGIYRCRFFLKISDSADGSLTVRSSCDYNAYIVVREVPTASEDDVPSWSAWPDSGTNLISLDVESISGTETSTAISLSSYQGKYLAMDVVWYFTTTSGGLDNGELYIAISDDGTSYYPMSLVPNINDNDEEQTWDDVTVVSWPIGNEAEVGASLSDKGIVALASSAETRGATGTNPVSEKAITPSSLGSIIAGDLSDTDSDLIVCRKLSQGDYEALTPDEDTLYLIRASDTDSVTGMYLGSEQFSMLTTSLQQDGVTYSGSKYLNYVGWQRANTKPTSTPVVDLYGNVLWDDPLHSFYQNRSFADSAGNTSHTMWILFGSAYQSSAGTWVTNLPTVVAEFDLGFSSESDPDLDDNSDWHDTLDADDDIWMRNRLSDGTWKLVPIGNHQSGERIWFQSNWREVRSTNYNDVVLDISPVSDINVFSFLGFQYRVHQSYGGVNRGLAHEALVVRPTNGWPVDDSSQQFEFIYRQGYGLTVTVEQIAGSGTPITLPSNSGSWNSIGCLRTMKIEMRDHGSVSEDGQQAVNRLFLTNKGFYDYGGLRMFGVIL